MIPGELKTYDGEYAYAGHYYLYIAAIGAWLQTFRVPRKHDNMPVVYATPKRQYFLDVLAKQGFDVSNGKIPTPIFSYNLTSIALKQDLSHPKEILWFNVDDMYSYPDMDAFDYTFQITLWTRKQFDRFEIDFQIRNSFNQFQRWIVLEDPETHRSQYMYCKLEGISDTSTTEPGAELNVEEWRTDYSVIAEAYVPRMRYAIPPIKKVFIDFQTGDSNDMCTIDYISGNLEVKNAKLNRGALCGEFEDGHIYFSGIVNLGDPDEEYVYENVFYNHTSGDILF